MKKYLIEKYLTETSPLSMTYELMDDQLDDFMKLLKMETPPSWNSDFNKLLKQFKMFKKSLETFVNKIS